MMTQMFTREEAIRISLDTSFLEAITKMSNGNPGAITVMAALTKAYSKIDSQSALKEWTPLLWLDDKNIYGSDIWVLFKDVCRESLFNTVVVMRSVQMGLIGIDSIRTAMRHRATPGLDFAELNRNLIAKGIMLINE